jgi:hypothetical protein
MATPKKVRTAPVSRERIAPNTPAKQTQKPVEPVPSYRTSINTENHPDAISPTLDFHRSLDNIAGEIGYRIDKVNAGTSLENKDSSRVAVKTAPAQNSVTLARGLISNAERAHKAGDAWTATKNMRAASHHIINAVNYLNSDKAFGGETKSGNANNFWAANSRRSEGDGGVKGPSLTNVHKDVSDVLNGYLSHVANSSWTKKNHITNNGTDYSSETFSPNNTFEGYGVNPYARKKKPLSVIGTDEDKHFRTQIYPHWVKETGNSPNNFVDSDAFREPRKYALSKGLVLSPYVKPKKPNQAALNVAKTGLESAITRREYAKQIYGHWREKYPEEGATPQTFASSSAYRHPEEYAKQHGIELNYPAKELYAATNDPFHLTVNPTLKAAAQGKKVTEGELDLATSRGAKSSKKDTVSKDIAGGTFHYDKPFEDVSNVTVEPNNPDENIFRPAPVASTPRGSIKLEFNVGQVK